MHLVVILLVLAVAGLIVSLLMHLSVRSLQKNEFSLTSDPEVLTELQEMQQCQRTITVFYHICFFAAACALVVVQVSNFGVWFQNRLLALGEVPYEKQLGATVIQLIHPMGIATGIALLIVIVCVRDFLANRQERRDLQYQSNLATTDLPPLV